MDLKYIENKVRSHTIMYNILRIIYSTYSGFLWYLAYMIGHIPNHIIRILLYRHIIRIQIGKNSSIHRGARFYAPNKIKIGTNSVIGPVCFLDGRGDIIIKDNCVLGGGTWIFTAEHEVNSPKFDVITSPVIIENYVWTGSRALILPGVTLGEGCVVAAGSIVTKNVDPYTIVAGVPAKKIGERIRNLDYNPAYRMSFG